MYRRAHEGRACIFCYQQTKRAKIFDVVQPATDGL